MSYLIILLVIALALGPIVALKPTKTQKRQIQLRNCAREAGLQVQVCRLPQTHRQQVRREDPELGLAYRLLWHHEVAKVRQFNYLVHREETEPGTAPQSIQRELDNILAQLPEAILAVEFTNLGVAVYWRENGDCELVKLIAARLQSLKSALENIHW